MRSCTILAKVQAIQDGGDQESRGEEAVAKEGHRDLSNVGNRCTKVSLAYRLILVAS